MAFWNFIKNQENDEEVELRIEGDITMDDDFWSWLFGIETVTPKSFREQLSEQKGKNITVWINSNGGDVFAASQIYTALKEHKGKVTVKVDGVAISAASVIAMAGDEIEMSPTSIMMIHNPWGYWQGESKDFRHAAEVLDEVKETIVNAYQLKSRKSRKKISEMMDNETWMSAKTALNEGFIDGILYSESQSQEPVENSFMFSRMAIQNSATDSIKKFIEQYNERLKQNQKLNKTEEPPKPEAFLMPENMTPKNLAAAFRSANRSGEQTDDPEGSMYIAISDTLANQIADYLESLPEPKEEPRQVPVDLYTKLYENLERRAKL